MFLCILSNSRVPLALNTTHPPIIARGGGCLMERGLKCVLNLCWSSSGRHLRCEILLDEQKFNCFLVGVRDHNSHQKQCQQKYPCVTLHSRDQCHFRGTIFAAGLIIQFKSINIGDSKIREITHMHTHTPPGAVNTLE
jgi:hypothetical protein